LGEVIVMNIEKLFAPWRRLAALAAGAAMAGLFLPSAAMAATATYTTTGCTSFVVTGTPQNQTVTCVTGGSTVPVCAPTANPPTPSAGQATTITANCSNQPLANSYTWTGVGCMGLTGPTCDLTGKTGQTSKTFSVSATNSMGAGPAAQITVTWH